MGRMTVAQRGWAFFGAGLALVIAGVGLPAVVGVGAVLGVLGLVATAIGAAAMVGGIVGVVLAPGIQVTATVTPAPRSRPLHPSEEALLPEHPVAVFLRSRPGSTATQIASALELPVPAVERTLGELDRAGLVVRDGNGSSFNRP